jgi:D-3-phosphoglycerate dehydrogenase
MKIGILEPDNFSAVALSELKILGKVSLYKGDIPLSDFIRDKSVLFIRLKFKLSKELLSEAKHLQIICSPTTGLNHIDSSWCKTHGIKIISLRGEKEFLKTIRATPEHTLGLVIALLRNYRKAFLNSKNTVWNRDPLRGFEIYGSSIGIIGMGRVGKILAMYFKTMGAHVTFYDIRSVKKGAGINRANSMNELIAGSEILVLCADYSEERGVILGKKEIDAMKGKYFINTARAELTDEEYLLKKANSNHFKGLALDVITNEQDKKNLLDQWLKASDHTNILITPHIGGATFTSMNRTEEFIVSGLLKHVKK